MTTPPTAPDLAGNGLAAIASISLLVPTAPRKLQTIEAGRGIAATLVVLFHASASIFPAAKYWNTIVFAGIFDFGFAGVEFFFVLSGFIIAFAHWSDLGRASRLPNYLWRRFARIYPAYWVVLSGMIILAWRGIGPPLPPMKEILSSVLLLGNDYSLTIVGVAWTLYHEIAFYLVFAVSIWRPAIGVALAVAAIFCAALQAMGVGLSIPLYWASPVNILFVFGIAAWAWSRKPRRHAAVLALIGAATFFVLGCDTVYGRHFSETSLQLLFGLASAVGIAGTVAAERRSPIAVPWLFRKLGAASYSIYLVHFPVLSLLAQVAVRFDLIRRAPAWFEFVIIVGLTLIAGYVFHRLIERPLLAWTQRRGMRGRVVA